MLRRGPSHPTGLHVRTFKTNEGVASPILISRQYEGPPGAAHGGIVAAYLDEVLAATVLRVTGRLGVTGELTIRYMKPVPTETPDRRARFARCGPWPLCGCRRPAGGPQHRRRLGDRSGTVLSVAFLKTAHFFFGASKVPPNGTFGTRCEFARWIIVLFL